MIKTSYVNIMTKYGNLNCKVCEYNYVSNSFDFSVSICVNNEVEIYNSRRAFLEDEKKLIKQELLDTIIELIDSENGICIDGTFYDLDNMSLEKFISLCKRKYIGEFKNDL